MSSQRDLFDQGAGSGSPSRSERPLLTIVACVACVVIFLGVNFSGDRYSWQTLNSFGYYSARDVWNGAFWSLLLSPFVHIEIWHVAFNVYWFWVLGSRIELALGSGRYLVFIVLAAFVSSSCQMAVTDAPGHGASGVVYALFGFMWFARRRYPGFYEVVGHNIVALFLIWLVGCYVVTYLGIFNIGNEAHLSGLICGCLVGGLMARRNPLIWFAALAGLVVLSAIPLFWCPWSVTWIGVQAYKAHAAKDYRRAIQYYDQLIGMNPYDAWALENRALAFEAIGEKEKALRDLQKSKKLESKIKR